MNVPLPIPSSTAAALMRAKVPVPTSLNTAELRVIEAAIKRRAIFSARNTQISVLQRTKDAVVEMLEGRSNRATARMELARALDATGYTASGGFPDDAPGTVPPAVEGGLRDLRSQERRELVIETQFRLAANEAYYNSGLSDLSRLQWPAWELIRISPRRIPRGQKMLKGGLVDDPGQDWPARWIAAGGELFEGRMIAAKDSDVWQALGDGEGGFEDTLGNPYPPFAFGSGYGIREIAREEALIMGVISESDEIARPTPQLAADLQRDKADLDPELLEAFRKDIETRPEDGRARMRRILEEELAAADAAYRNSRSLRNRCRRIVDLLQRRAA